MTANDNNRSATFRADKASVVLRRLEIFASAFAIAGGALITACTAFAAQLWEYPFPRGCMLIIVRNCVLAVVVSGAAWIYARVILGEIEKGATKSFVITNLVSLFLVIMSGYFLFGKNVMPAIAFTSCYLAWPGDDYCNLKTNSLNEEKLLKLSQGLLELQASPFPASVRVETATKNNADKGSNFPPF